ncbi:unnamed protein product, partial [Mesorhabditis spiculigera]
MMASQTSIQRSLISTNCRSLEEREKNSRISEQAGQELTSNLSTIFVIVYLQEAAWICAPLIISINVLLHAFLRNIGEEKRLFSCAFGFFAATALASLIGLWLVHRRALPRLQQFYLLPYFITKLIRMTVLLVVSVFICVDTDRRKQYFYISLYAGFECLAGIVVLEIVYRSWKYLRKAKNRKEQKDGEVLWREPLTSIRSSQSIP